MASDPSNRVILLPEIYEDEDEQECRKYRRVEMAPRGLDTQ